MTLTKKSGAKFNERVGISLSFSLVSEIKFSTAHLKIATKKHNHYFSGQVLKDLKKQR